MGRQESPSTPPTMSGSKPCSIFTGERRRARRWVKDIVAALQPVLTDVASRHKGALGRRRRIRAGAQSVRQSRRERRRSQAAARSRFSRLIRFALFFGEVGISSLSPSHPNAAQARRQFHAEARNASKFPGRARPHPHPRRRHLQPARHRRADAEEEGRSPSC